MSQRVDFLCASVNEKHLVELISDLIRIPSYQGIENQEYRVAEYIQNYFIDSQIDCELIPVDGERSNVYAKILGDKPEPVLLFNGHIDTVPPYEMGNACHPLIEGRQIKGRGSCDMKGAVACMMYALRIIMESGIKLPGTLIFTAVIDEELTSKGTRAFLKSGIKADAAVIGEPMAYSIGLGHKGLQWFQFDIHGKSVHGGEQEKGINAIGNASILINAIEERLVPRLRKRIHPLIGTSTLNYGLIRGGSQPSTVAGECMIQLDRRWIPGEAYADVCREFEELICDLEKSNPGFKCDFSVVENSLMEDGIIHEVCITDESEPIVKAAEKAMVESIGQQPEKKAFPAWSDGGLLNYYGKIPVIIMGPGELSCAHTDREYIDIDQAVEFVKIYIKTAMNFLHWEDT